MRAVSEPMNPYSAPSLVTDPLAAQEKPRFGGVNRSQYIAQVLATWIVFALLFRSLAPYSGQYMPVAAISFALLQIGVLFYLVAQRNINLGYNPYWCLGLLVPLVNLFVGVRCLLLPEGYAHHKRLDSFAWVMLCPVIILPALKIINILSK